MTPGFAEASAGMNSSDDFPMTLKYSHAAARQFMHLKVSSP
jgi:hypothetical protein